MSDLKTTNDVMQRIARTVDFVLNDAARPDRNGFVVLAFARGGETGVRVNYVSNCERADIVVALKELLARFEGQPAVQGSA